MAATSSQVSPAARARLSVLLTTPVLVLVARDTSRTLSFSVQRSLNTSLVLLIAIRSIVPPPPWFGGSGILEATT
jgi:hypothetical protein